MPQIAKASIEDFDELLGEKPEPKKPIDIARLKVLAGKAERLLLEYKEAENTFGVAAEGFEQYDMRHFSRTGEFVASRTDQQILSSSDAETYNQLRALKDHHVKWINGFWNFSKSTMSHLL
jgi:hypothetical protein